MTTTELPRMSEEKIVAALIEAAKQVVSDGRNCQNPDYRSDITIGKWSLVRAGLYSGGIGTKDQRNNPHESIYTIVLDHFNLGTEDLAPGSPYCEIYELIAETQDNATKKGMSWGDSVYELGEYLNQLRQLEADVATLESGNVPMINQEQRMARLVADNMPMGAQDDPERPTYADTQWEDHVADAIAGLEERQSELYAEIQRIETALAALYDLET